jgi:hypothetical protein
VNADGSAEKCISTAEKVSSTSWNTCMVAFARFEISPMNDRHAAE